VVARCLTTIGGVDALAGGWAIFWNELLDGAPPGRHRSVAAAVTRLSRPMMARTGTARWFDATLPEPTAHSTRARRRARTGT
jgi:hypothetical protein